jgi:hypothetical protein
VIVIVVMPRPSFPRSLSCVNFPARTKVDTVRNL